MWTSNSGPPFNQPSKSSTKWAFVRYRPGPVGGGGGSHRLPHDRHSMAAGVVEKSVSTGTTAITGVAGGRSGSSTNRLPCTSNATGGSWSATAVATSTLASPFQIRRCSGTGRYIPLPLFLSDRGYSHVRWHHAGRFPWGDGPSSSLVAVLP